MALFLQLIALGLRRELKRVPTLRRLVHALRRSRWELNAVKHGMSTGAGHALARHGKRERFSAQATFDRTGPDSARPEDLLARLRAGAFRHVVTPDAIHIPSQPGLDSVFGDAVEQYPSDSAFRLTKGIKGGERSLVLVANLLHLKGLGPRVYDAFSLGSGPGWHTVLVIQEASAPESSPHRQRSVIDAISELVASRQVRAHRDDWSDDKYLARVRTNGARLDLGYVGFENFEVQNPRSLVKAVLDKKARSELHFGTEYVLKGRRYLYQSVPGAGATGRRNTVRRWLAIRSLLAEVGVSPQNRLILDIGCNAGMMLTAALAEGALWGLGWDLPDVASNARNVMLALGFTRFDIFGTTLTADYQLLDDVPEWLAPSMGGALVFYLAVRHNVGFFPSGLRDVPWSTLVYEGGEEESVETLPRDLEPLRQICDFSVEAAVDFRDSETRSRPLAVLVRR